MIHKLILYFDPLSIGHMGEPRHQHLDHNQTPNNTFCPVVYHHRVVDWCYQCWILLSTCTSCNFILNGLILYHGLQ